MFSDMKVLHYFEECIILKKLMPFIDYRHELMTTNEQYALFLSIRIQILVAGYTGATAQLQTMVELGLQLRPATHWKICKIFTDFETAYYLMAVIPFNMTIHRVCARLSSVFALEHV